MNKIYKRFGSMTPCRDKVRVKFGRCWVSGVLPRPQVRYPHPLLFLELWKIQKYNILNF